MAQYTKKFSQIVQIYMPMNIEIVSYDKWNNIWSFDSEDYTLRYCNDTALTCG